MGNGDGQAIRSYRDLVVWQRGVDLVESIYRLSADFPSDERFGLVSQVRRAAVSVPSNVAEGYGRGTRADYLRFLRMARGSLCEVETHVLLAGRLGFINEEQRSSTQQQVDDTARVLSGLIRSLAHQD